MDKQSERGEEYLQPLWSRAGTACRLREENMEAVGFFLRAGDYSAAYQTLNPWTSCAPSVVYMFWRETGGLSEACHILTQDIHYYRALTGGGGSGAPEAMQAELRLLSGAFSEAEVLAYKALYLADRHGQDSICFCAELTLGRIALLRGDATGFTHITEAIRRRAFEGREFRCVTTGEVCLGFLWSLLDMDEHIVGWLGYEAIRWAAEQGIIKGYSETTFGTEEMLTRQELATMLYRYGAYKGYDVSASGSISHFTDQPSEWARESVQWAVGTGILSGKGSGVLDPHGPAASLALFK